MLGVVGRTKDPLSHGAKLVVGDEIFMGEKYHLLISEKRKV